MKLSAQFKSNGYCDTIISKTISQVYSEYKQINIIDTDEKEKKDKIYLKLPYKHNSKQTNDTINNIDQKLPKIHICPIYETNKTKDPFKTKSKDANSVRSFYL